VQQLESRKLVSSPVTVMGAKWGGSINLAGAHLYFLACAPKNVAFGYYIIHRGKSMGIFLKIFSRQESRPSRFFTQNQHLRITEIIMECVFTLIFVSKIGPYEGLPATKKSKKIGREQEFF
jgi:hypothetical protein